MIVIFTKNCCTGLEYVGHLLLVHGDPDGLQLGNLVFAHVEQLFLHLFRCFVFAHFQDTHLVLDGSVDLVESGDPRELLRDLLVVGPLLGVLAELKEKKNQLNLIYLQRIKTWSL